MKIAANGIEAGMDWQADLPEPTLDGSTATYHEVLPGVDLKVTADVIGYSQLLVVKSPEAAKNPRLKKITFDARAKGAEVSVDKGQGSGRRSDLPAEKQTAADGVKVTDQAGKTAFKIEASAMWDSSGTPIPGAPGPGEGARTAAMGVEVTDSTISVSPDQQFLAAPETKFPVFVDPSHRCASCSKAHHVVVQSAWPDALNFDKTDGALGDLKAGYVCEGGDCFKSRTYLRMHTGSLVGKHIIDAHLHLDTIHSYHCTNATPTYLYLAPWVGSNTTWNNQPGGSGNPLSSGNTTKNVNHCPGNPGGMDLAATSAIASAAAGGWGETTFMIRGEREDNNSSWRRFDLNPYLVVNYNSYPLQPADLGIQGWGPNAGDALACGSYVATRTPRLRARLSDPDNDVLNAIFHLSPAGSQHAVGNVPSGSFGEITVPAGKITADGPQTWHVTVGDNDLLGPQSANCSMVIDTTVPGEPVVASSQYPAGKDAGGIGVGGSFALSAPTGTDDIAYYLYSFSNQGDDPQTKVTPQSLNGPTTVTWTPMVSGPQVLSVRSVDRAGNRSTIKRYQIDVADYQVGVSGKIAQWSFENNLVDTSEAKSLNYIGPPPPGGYFGEGQSGRAVLMDAVNKEYYQAKDALLRTDGSFTVSAWASLASDDKYYTVASQDGSRASGFKLQYNDYYDRWAISFTNGDVDNPSTIYKALSANPPALNTWTHLTGVYDATAAKLRIYVDGALSGEATVPVTPWNATGPFVVGAAKVDGARSHHFTGSIDSVRVHGRVLSATEISALPGGTPAGSTAEYLFEENLKNTGSNTDLALATGAPTYQAGYSGSAFQVNPAFGSSLRTSGPILSTTASFSAGAWVKLQDKTKHQAVFSQDGNRMSAFMLRYAPDVDRWIFGTSDSDTDAGLYYWAKSTSVPKEGVWTHLAVVHDTTTHKLSLYVNGIREAQRDANPTFNATGTFVVGAAKVGGNPTARWFGLLDEVNVYDGALTDAEVATLNNAPVERARYALDGSAVDSVGGVPTSVYGNGVSWENTNGVSAAKFTGNHFDHSGVAPSAAPIGEWHLDGSLTDTSGGGRDLNARKTSGATTPSYINPGIFWQGATFNGVDNWLQRDTAVLDTSKSFSVSAFVKLDRDNGWFTVASQDGVRAASFVLQYSDQDDRWAFSMINGDQDESPSVGVLSTHPPKIGTWTHLMGVYDAVSGKARLFVNGTLEGEAPFSSAWASAGPFVVGAVKWSGNRINFFPGAIDEVRVYDRALTADDAHGLWNMGSNIRAGRAQAFRTDQSYTVAAMARADVFDATARTVLSGDGMYSPFLLSYRPEWKRWGLLVFVGADNTGEARWILSDNEAATYQDVNGWVHLAAVYDAPARKMRFLVNGIEQSTVPLDGTRVAKVGPGVTPPAWYAGVSTASRDTSRELVIGRATFEGRMVDHWKGAVRDVRVFSGVLPDACDAAPVCLSQLPGR